MNSYACQDMIHAFFDDSSDNKRTEFVACGGVFGDAFNMAALDNLWSKATAHLEEPFRSTDCECGYGQFRKWEQKDRVELFSKLVDILVYEPLRVQIVGNVIPVGLYHQVFPGSDTSAPYRLALRHLFMQMARIARKTRTERVECWFERGSVDGDVRSAFQDVMQYPYSDFSLRYGLKGLHFGDKTNPLLQAADLAARETYKVRRNLGELPFRKPLLRLWEHTGIVAWTEDSLRTLRDIGEPLSASSLSAMPDSTFMMQVAVTPYSVIRTAI